MKTDKVDYFLLKEIESYVFSALRGNVDEPFEFLGFQIAIKKHSDGDAYVCCIKYETYIMNFLIQNEIIDNSLIPETIMADFICKQLTMMIGKE